MGLMCRPLIPPVWLICATNRRIAFSCSPNSASSAKPSFPASELSETTGKTTLISFDVTPRLEVLAELTDVSPEEDELVPDPTAAEAELDELGAVPTHTAVPATTAVTTATVRIRTASGRQANRCQVRTGHAVSRRSPSAMPQTGSPDDVRHRSSLCWAT